MTQEIFYVYYEATEGADNMQKFFVKGQFYAMLLKFAETNRSAGLNFMNFDSLLKTYYWDFRICFEYTANCEIACE